MDESLVKLLITIGTTVAGIVLGVFKDDIKNFFSSSKKYKYLYGKWKCTWVENPSKHNPAGKNFTDVTEITTIRGAHLKGTGDAEGLGQWSFKGQVGVYTIALTYKVSVEYDRSGVIILQKLEDNKKKLVGFWSQYKQGELVTGTTEWNKISIP